MFNRIFAVGFEPFGDDCIHTVNVKGHKIILILFGNAEAFENGGEDVVIHLCVCRVHSQSACVFNYGAKQFLMFFDIVEIRRKVAWNYEIEFFKRTGFNLLNKFARLFVHMGYKFFDDEIHTFGKQIVNCFVVQVKSGAVDLSFFANFFNRDESKVLLLKKFKKCFVHTDCGVEIFAFGFVHGNAPLHIFFADFSCKLYNFKGIFALALFQEFFVNRKVDGNADKADYSDDNSENK